MQEVFLFVPWSEGALRESVWTALEHGTSFGPDPVKVEVRDGDIKTCWCLSQASRIVLGDLLVGKEPVDKLSQYD